jgi:hypothetical protein
MILTSILCDSADSKNFVFLVRVARRKPSSTVFHASMRRLPPVSVSAESRKKVPEYIYCIPGRINFSIRGTTRIDKPPSPARCFIALPTFNA